MEIMFFLSENSMICVLVDMKIVNSIALNLHVDVIRKYVNIGIMCTLQVIIGVVSRVSC